MIADAIGQIKIPVWKGTFIIFPIFYALFLGLLTGPNILKILDDKKVKAAAGLVGVAILPFVAKLGIRVLKSASNVFLLCGHMMLTVLDILLHTEKLFCRA